MKLYTHEFIGERNEKTCVAHAYIIICMFGCTVRSYNSKDFTDSSKYIGNGRL